MCEIWRDMNVPAGCLKTAVGFAFHTLNPIITASKLLKVAEKNQSRQTRRVPVSPSLYYISSPRCVLLLREHDDALVGDDAHAQAGL